MLEARIYFDTNVFILLKEGIGELPQRLVDLIAEAGSSSGRRIGTSELTLAELLAKPYAQAQDELIDQYDSWIRPSSWLEVGPVDRDILRYAAVFRSRNGSVKLPDAIHVATAIGLGCQYLLTNDTGLKGKYSITHTRYGLARFSSEVEVVRPDPETLARLKADLTGS